MGTASHIVSLRERLERINPLDFHEPDMVISPKDHTVGPMTDTMIRLFTLYRQTAKEEAEVLVQLRFGRTNSSEKDAIEAKAHELHSKAEVLKRLFWAEVKEAYSLWGKDSIGVRAGYVVVWSDESADQAGELSPLHHLADLLKGLES